MSAPDLSAFVPPDTRVRLSYGLVWPAFEGPDGLEGDLSDTLQGYPYAVLYGLPTSPSPGPDGPFGLTHTGGTTADLKTSHDLPSMTWDQWLQPLRTIPGGDWRPHGVATLQDVELLAVGGITAASTAAQRTQAAGAAAQQAPLQAPGGAFLRDLSSLGTWGVVLVVAIVAGLALWTFGPALRRGRAS